MYGIILCIPIVLPIKKKIWFGGMLFVALRFFFFKEGKKVMEREGRKKEG